MMKISPLQQLFKVIRGMPKATALQLMTPGDRLSGQIVNLEAGGRYLMQFGTFKASAAIGFPVNIGDTITAVVTDAGPPLKLKVISDPRLSGDQSTETVRHRRREASETGNRGGKFRMFRWQPAFDHAQPLHPSGQSRLRPPKKRIDVDNLLGRTGEQHRRSHLNHQVPENTGVHLNPASLNDDSREVVFRIHCSERKPGRPKSGVHISMLLNLSRLGDVRVDLESHPGMLHTTFYVTDPVKKQLLDVHLHQLTDRFNDWYHESVCRVVVSTLDIEAFFQVVIDPPSAEKLDVRA